MAAIKLAEILPQNPTSAKPSTRKDVCGECKREFDHPIGFAPTPGGPQKMCSDCAAKVQAETAIRNRIPKQFKKAEIEDLSASLQAKIKSLPEPKGLLLWGLPGVGKSYAMCAIAKQYIRQGKEIERIGYEMLCLRIRDTYKANTTKGELDVIDPLCKVENLIVEDVGVTVSVGQQESNFSLRTFLVLLDQRLEECRPTFITTNKSVEELGKSFDQRIASRLQQACEVVQLKGEDKRK